MDNISCFIISTCDCMGISNKKWFFKKARDNDQQANPHPHLFRGVMLFCYAINTALAQPLDPKVIADDVTSQDEAAEIFLLSCSVIYVS